MSGRISAGTAPEIITGTFGNFVGDNTGDNTGEISGRNTGKYSGRWFGEYSGEWFGRLPSACHRHSRQSGQGQERRRDGVHAGRLRQLLPPVGCNGVPKVRRAQHQRAGYQARLLPRFKVAIGYPSLPLGTLLFGLGEVTEKGEERYTDWTGSRRSATTYLVPRPPAVVVDLATRRNAS